MAFALMTMAAQARCSNTALRTSIGSSLKDEGGMVPKPRCDGVLATIASVVWVIIGPSRGVTPVYGACWPSKSTTYMTRLDKLASTWNRTPQ